MPGMLKTPGLPIDTYKITFKDDNGNVLQELEVDSGETPVYSGPDISRDYYTQIWIPEISAATEDTEYTAVYAKVAECLKVAGDMGEKYRRAVFMVTNEDALEALPSWAATGSIAVEFSTGLDEEPANRCWFMNLGGDWEENNMEPACILTSLF